MTPTSSRQRRTAPRSSSVPARPWSAKTQTICLTSTPRGSAGGLRHRRPHPRRVRERPVGMPHLMNPSAKARGARSSRAPETSSPRQTITPQAAAPAWPEGPSFLGALPAGFGCARSNRPACQAKPKPAEDPRLKAPGKAPDPGLSQALCCSAKARRSDQALSSCQRRSKEHAMRARLLTALGAIALSALLALALAPAAQAEFGFSDFDVTFTDPDGGAPVTQAGSNTAVGACAVAQFVSGGNDPCPLDTQVGSAVLQLGSLEADPFTGIGVYN